MVGARRRACGGWLLEVREAWRASAHSTGAAAAPSASTTTLPP
eukprot:CAMPEP_0181331664 /NCGR_PEP_ID=MMETSP1101-20121128/24634_1 /TAXON_ID=46948 /ORGANISM="Rhodomonas abbreviata, Strain Caron Lab Isolate" /LENGTH=42 /DNA_ID= /DNA_START= /DNA_END= /DNA_ORIENTATION=